MTRRALLTVLVVAAGWGEAAAIDPAGRAAVDRGVAFLRTRFAAGPAAGGGHGLGEAALAGLAMLEGGAPATDPTVAAIAAGVRQQCLPDQQTYHVALSVLFLDRLGEPSDRGLIQVLGVKLYAGLLASGGYTYSLDDGWSGDVARTLATLQEHTLRTKPVDPPKGAKPPGGFAPPPAAKGGKGEPPPTGMHPLAEQYFKLVQFRMRGNRRNEPGDNSNTQFGLIGLWVAARNGVPADDAFQLIERRFLGSQGRDAGWAYSGTGESTPAMTCAGLLGLAVGAGRASATPPDRRGAQPRPEGFAPPPPKKEKDDGLNLEGVKNKRAVAAAVGYLAARVRAKAGEVGAGNAYYVLWSIERACMAYGLPDLGGTDWYQWGADFLLPAQQADGSWPAGTNCSAEVDTCFAILFLMKSNLVSDLSRLIKPQDNVMRAGDGLPPIGSPKTDAPKPADVNPLVAAADADFPAKLAAVRDAKGPDNTQTLADAIPKLAGDRQTPARQALAERLTRMTANTLRGMMKAGAEEVKRAAATAAGAKGDKGLLPDLATLIADPADGVVQAARESLKKLTGADHGPQPGADAAAKAKAQAAWRAVAR